MGEMKRVSDVCDPDSFKTIKLTEIPAGEDFVIRGIELKDIINKESGQINILCIVAIDRASGEGQVQRVYASTFNDVLIRQLKFLEEKGFPFIASLLENDDRSIVLM